jgi:hypothetical protein
MLIEIFLGGGRQYVIDVISFERTQKSSSTAPLNFRINTESVSETSYSFG